MTNRVDELLAELIPAMQKERDRRAESIRVLRLAHAEPSVLGPLLAVPAGPSVGPVAGRKPEVSTKERVKPVAGLPDDLSDAFAFARTVGRGMFIPVVDGRLDDITVESTGDNVTKMEGRSLRRATEFRGLSYRPGEDAPYLEQREVGPVARKGMFLGCVGRVNDPANYRIFREVGGALTLVYLEPYAEADAEKSVG